MSSATGLSERARPLALDDDMAALLEQRVRDALALARRDGARHLASVTVPIDPALDIAATLLLGRTEAERTFCLELPDRDRAAVCGLGVAASVRAAGPDRFAKAAAECRRLADRVLGPGLDPDAPPGSGPIFTGGFAFAPDGAGSPEWAGFEPLDLVVPVVSVARRGDHARMTVNIGIEADESAAALVEGVRERLALIGAAGPGLLDPSPAERPRVAGAAPPSHYEEAVRRAVQRIRAGELSKIVLAREVRVHADRPTDPAAVFGVLRESFRECYCYAVCSGARTFLGASPELLIRRDGAAAQTVALAGTTRRSADPAVDDHLGQQLRVSDKNASEHRIVAERIRRTLDPVALWVTDASDPQLVRVQNVQHLATPIRAQLAESVSALELAGLLHPTPAVGGEPAELSEQLIPALEGFDRGWYAGGIGWTDLADDGEFCVALRCALLDGPVAHLYAGCGIVAGSVASDELAETETKLEALLPLLS